MKPKAKFAYLLSMSGSLLGKDNIGRRLHLPRVLSASGKLAPNGNGAGKTSAHEPVCDPKEQQETVGSRKERRLPRLTLMVERIAHQSRGEQKPRHT